MPEKTQGDAKVTPIRRTQKSASAAAPASAPADQPPADETPAPSITDLVDAFLTEQGDLGRADDGRMNYAKSVQAFIAASDWLGPEHMPAVVSLTKIAESLDVELSAALAGQFGVTFRDLRAQAPAGSPDDDDPVERALRDREKGTGS